MTAPRALARAAPEPRPPLRRADGSPVVSPRIMARLRSLTEAIFATAAGPPPAARVDWVVAEVEDVLAHAGAQMRWTMAAATLVIVWIAPLFVGRLGSLASLPFRERVRALAALEASALGGPVLAVKALLCILYYEHPDAAAEVGFDAECLGLPSPAALGPAAGAEGVA
ncbi:MAG: hypothetical protein IT376_17185 [Polyangiaceae bacterium]|nr:hypothetical protein [Polyangiaceae bacterium]